MTETITQWLEALDLGRYAEAFIDNEITVGDLPHLTEADLIELGLPIGPRRRALHAISLITAVEVLPGEPAEAEQASATDADRRQLTVMFVDLVGSTELSARLDPEDLRGVMRHYQAAVARVIEENGGYLANWLGDGAIAYFGWPSAREDQALQAVRAGLAAVEAVGSIPLHDASGEMLAARVGIATGQVVVGDLEQGSTGQHGMVTGETPNLAARLEAVAPPGGVVIGRTTRAVVRAAFDLDFLGPQELKGFGAPIDTWQVRAERAAESRFEAPGGRLTAFTGRRHEVGLLLDRWEQARAGEGQVVLISGEPGIGKSRIVRAFREGIEGDRHRRILYQCSPYHVNTALYPAIRQLQFAAGLTPGDAPETRLDRLEQLLRQGTPDIRETAPLVAALLSIPSDGRYEVPEMPPQQQRVATLHALRDQLIGLAASEPVLFVLEDAHWIDPTTQELIVETVPRLADQPIMMLITHRPEWADPFQGQGHVTALNLTRLSRAQVGEMVRDVAGHELSETAIARIVDRTDGVPLFVEELTKAMAEADFEIAEADVPVTLQASLMARLDRLGPAKEIAQLGAVIGREFDRDLLAGAIGKDGDELGESLDRLVGSQLVYRSQRDQAEVYTFKHALIQDVAYDSLLRQRRQSLHLTIADALSADKGAGAPPEVLARHYEQGGDLARAMRCWEQAGDAAVARSAQPEAAAHYENALRLHGAMASPDADGRALLSLLLRLGQAQFGAIGGAAPATSATFERAKTIAATLDAPVDQYVAHYGYWVSLMIAGRIGETVGIAEELAGLAETTGDASMRVVAHRAMGSTSLMLGQIREARENYLKCLAILDDAPVTLPAALAHDPALTAPVLLAHVESASGMPEAALERSEACIAAARSRATNPNTITFILTWHVMLCLVQRAVDRMVPAFELLRDHTERSGGVFPRDSTRMGLGSLDILRGDYEAGLANLRAGIDGWTGASALQTIPIYKIYEAEAHLMLGDAAGALAVLDDTHALIERTQQYFYAPEMHRWRGVVLEGMGRRDQAMDAYQTAIGIAEQQGNVLWGNRAAKNLAAISARS